MTSVNKGFVLNIDIDMDMDGYRPNISIPRLLQLLPHGLKA